MSEKQPAGISMYVLAVFVILVNLYAGGCVIHGLGPIEAFRSMAATPSFIVDFLLRGLGVYIVAIGLVGVVALPLRLIRKRRFSGKTFLVWTTAVNFFIVAIAGAGSA